MQNRKLNDGGAAVRVARAEAAAAQARKRLEAVSLPPGDPVCEICGRLCGVVFYVLRPNRIICHICWEKKLEKIKAEQERNAAEKQLEPGFAKATPRQAG